MPNVVETVKGIASTSAAKVTAQVIVTAAALVATHYALKKIEDK